MENQASNRAIVIGAGIAGLAVAIRLKLRGYQVKVFEMNDRPGGKIGEFYQGGCRFDTGPSLFTMPWLIDELFEAAGANPRQYFNYEVLGAGTYYWFADGTIVRPGSQRADFEKTLSEALDEPLTNVQSFLDRSEKLYHITSHVFLERSLHDPANYLRKATVQSFLKLPSLKIGRTMAADNAKRFRDPRVRQFFNRYATFNGSDPFKAPAVLNVIPHLEHNLGTYYPKGGIYRIIESLYELSQAMGIEFQFNEKIKEIALKGKKVLGVWDGHDQFHPGNTVISNMDVDATHRELLSTEYYPAFYLDRPKSSSAVIFYWKVQGEHQALGLHNIFFSGDYQSEFHQLFEKGSITNDPTVYIYISARANPEDAPENAENWYVMINAPYDSGQNWEHLIAKARQCITQKISCHLGYSIEKNIETESIWHPPGIEAKTGSYRGALYGNNSNSAMAAFLRHPNFSSQLKGLYFCGGSVHPGGGIPLCLLSAKIVAELIQRKSKVSC